MHWEDASEEGRLMTRTPNCVQIREVHGVGGKKASHRGKSRWNQGEMRLGRGAGFCCRIRESACMHVCVA